MKRQRRRDEPYVLCDDSRGQPIRAVLDQQAEDRKAMLVREGTECGDGVDGFHELRYYDKHRNVNRSRSAMHRAAVRPRRECCERDR